MCHFGSKVARLRSLDLLILLPTMDHKTAKAIILQKLREELPEARTYHSLEHTLDVYATTVSIAEKEGVSGDDLVMLRTAAMLHDLGFTEQDLAHEEVGCGIARRILPALDYAPVQVERICSMIMATRIPQSPGNDHLAQVLCDADLDYLGRTDFFVIGDRLFAEFKQYGVLSTERAWNELQVEFLNKHRYFTATSVRDREPVKQKNLRAVERWL